MLFRSLIPLEQKNGLPNPAFTQSQRVLAFEQGKAIGFVAQGAQCGRLTMTIGIGLDHGPGPRIWRQFADQATSARGRAKLSGRSPPPVFCVN